MDIKNKLGAALIVAVFFAVILTPSFQVARAASVSDLQAQINALYKQIEALQNLIKASGDSVTPEAKTVVSGRRLSCYVFNSNLTRGSSGQDVVALQQALQVNESGVFDDATQKAVVAFQESNSSEVLAPVGLTKGNGSVFARTRAKLNKLYKCDDSVSVVKPVEASKPADTGSVSNDVLPRSLTLVAPNGGERWMLNAENTIIQWSPDPHSRDIDAYLERMQNGQYVTVGKVVEARKGSIQWLGEIDKVGNYATPGDGYYIRLVNRVTGAMDRSDKPFTILPIDYMQVDMKINGSDDARVVPGVGADVTLSWTSKNASYCVFNPGILGTYLGDLATSGQRRIFLKPFTDGYNYSIWMTCYSKELNNASRGDYLDILSGLDTVKEGVTVTYPNGGEKFERGSGAYVRWQQSPATAGSADIYLVANPCAGMPYAGPTCPSSQQYLIARSVGEQQPVVCTDTIGAPCPLPWGSFKYYWSSIPSTLDKMLLPDGQYYIKICRAGTTTCDISNSSFTLVTSVVSNPVITSFMATPVSRVNGAVNLSWTASAATDAEIDMTCPAAGVGSISLYIKEDGRTVNCDSKNGLVHYLNQTGNTITVQPMGNTQPVTMDFILRLSKNGALTGQDQRVSVTFQQTATAPISPSISLMAQANGQATDKSIVIKVGDTVKISGVPQGLSGLVYGKDYTRAWFFDPIFNSSCSNNGVDEKNPEWWISCVAQTSGVAHVYLTIYRGSTNEILYISNTITVYISANNVAPAITSVSSKGFSSNQLQAGQIGYIMGTGFLGVNTVKLGSLNIPAYSYDGKNILFTVPSLASNTVHSLYVSNANGTSGGEAVTVWQ